MEMTKSVWHQDLLPRNQHQCKEFCNLKPKSFNIKIGTVCLASLSPAKDPTSAKLLEFFFNILENVQKEGGGGQRLFDQCKKMQNCYFGHP